MSGKGSKQREVDAAKFASNWDRIFADSREAMRAANLAEARETILNKPPMSEEIRARLDKAWADFDAAYPHELAPKPAQPPDSP
tara:strand:+ start:2874 stop:3125 length:252 start_codon:yes stop_codon:yes gene_type:complete